MSVIVTLSCPVPTESDEPKNIMRGFIERERSCGPPAQAIPRRFFFKKKKKDTRYKDQVRHCFKKKIEFMNST